MLVERCVELLDVATAGILVADGAGRLRVVATSSEQAEHLELFQIQNDEGPCLDAYRTGETVNVGQLGPESSWPGFAAESLRAGSPAVCAVPLRHRDQLLGCLNLFRSEPIALAEDDVHLSQALAAVASITMLQDEAARAAAAHQGQLQHALDSRVAIEQAKGMIVERPSAHGPGLRGVADLRPEHQPSADRNCPSARRRLPLTSTSSRAAPGRCRSVRRVEHVDRPDRRPVAAMAGTSACVCRICLATGTRQGAEHPISGGVSLVAH